MSEDLKKQLRKIDECLELKKTDNIVYDMLDIFYYDEVVYEYLEYVKDLQDRIDKAIEYIKNIDDEEFINTEHYVEILEILGDKENE